MLVKLVLPATAVTRYAGKIGKIGKVSNFGAILAKAVTR